MRYVGGVGLVTRARLPDWVAIRDRIIMETGQLNCAERIWAEVKDRAEYIKGLMDRQDDEAYQELAELPLGIETKRETTITLSYGGPADYLHITHDKGEVLRVVYRFSDWFDTATIELDESHELWDYAEYIIENNYI